MRYWMLLLFSITASLHADQASCAEYLELIRQYPLLITHPGHASEGEIEIIRDLDRMVAIEKKMGRKVGVVHRDAYWIWVNEACLFPSGKEGVYGRILGTKMQGNPRNAGVAVFPILPDGKIALNCNYRHATRSWEIELPRGMIEKNESHEDAVRREAKEETGCEIGSVQFLGEMPPDTGSVSFIVPVYAAKVVQKKEATPEDSEAIDSILSLSLAEIKQAFLEGGIECEIAGKKQKVPMRDPFLAYALLLYELKNKN